MNRNNLILILVLLSAVLLNVFSVAAQEKTDTTTAATTLKEQVKCIFVNSDAQQKCYTDDAKFGCYGIGTCIAEVSGEKGTKLSWKSSCEGLASTVIDENNEYAEFKCTPSEKSTEDQPAPGTLPQTFVKEQVKCIFVNSDTAHRCYTDDGAFECTGTGSCVADVAGEKGIKLTWKSSCEGYAYTVIDENNDYAEFKCASSAKSTSTTGTASTTSTSTAPKAAVKARVTCVFLGSAAPQTCYSDTGVFECSGTGSCVVDVAGEKGTKLTWKSSCGGYEYTVLSEGEDSVQFKCVPEEVVTQEQILGKGFRYAYWQCYNGEEQKEGDQKGCKSSEFWQSRAQEFCKGKLRKCYADGSKCGVNSYSVSDECYFEGGSGDVVFLPTVPTVVPPVTPRGGELDEEVLICKDSCPLDGKCYPFGHRKSSAYCSDTGSFVEQSLGDAACENNFECSSNVCVDGSCVRSGLIQKILAWLTELFE